jgi:Na+-transporting methylmalonyl-CoA/oxaloacetate decarboxylase gamma subunit
VIFASRRSRKGHDPHLNTKVILFSVGAVLGLAGMALEFPLLVLLAILVLAVGVALRMFPRRAESSGESDPEGGQTEPRDQGEGHE